jgi:hypothetical protein
MISLGSEGFWMGDYGGVRVGRHVMLAHAEYPRKGPNPGALKTSLDTHTHRDTHTHTHTDRQKGVLAAVLAQHRLHFFHVGHVERGLVVKVLGVHSCAGE